SGTTERRLVEDEAGLLRTVLVEAQRPEQVIAEVVRAGFLQEARRYDLIRIAIDGGDGKRDGLDVFQTFHLYCSGIRRRTSVRRPVTAAAAAMAGLIRWVRPPGPCRPTKLRFDVEAQRWPGA